MCVKEYLRLVTFQRVRRHACQRVGHIVAQDLWKLRAPFDHIVGSGMAAHMANFHTGASVLSRVDQFDPKVSPEVRTGRIWRFS